MCSSDLAYTAGQLFSFKSAGANTGAVTLNVSGLGVKNVTKNGTTALSAGDIAADAVVVVQYDGTEFQLVGGISGSSGGGDLSGAINFNQVSVAAATTSNLMGANANSILLTGNSPITITSFGTSTQAGAVRFVTSTGSGAHVLTNSSSLICPGLANITVAQGDSWIIVDEGSNIARIVEYTRAGTGTTCTLVAGTSANNLVQLDGSGNLPAVNGSNLTNVIATGTTSAKAWVYFNGTSSSPITPLGSYNVSSVTKNGTGDYTLNFTNAMSNSNYSVTTGGEVAAGNSRGGFFIGVKRLASTYRTTTAVTILTNEGANGGGAAIASDCADISVNIFD